MKQVIKIYTILLLLFIATTQGVRGQELDETKLNAFKADDTTIFRKEFRAEDYDKCFTIKESAYSPLLIAIKMDKPNIFSFLLESNIDLNRICDDKTPLMYAAKYGKTAFAKQLLKKGADKNIISPEGKTALDYAEKYKNYNISDILRPADSILSSDGPVIRYENGKIMKYQVVRNNNDAYIVKEEISADSTLTCYIDETKDTFSFRLQKKMETDTGTFSLPEKMLVVSDIEGNFKGFKSILTGSKVIDKNLNWTFGKNHLVLLGDFFDRGVNVTECLWLIYKLEGEARKQGGKVHFILGNHELMNLRGHLKYVRDKYLVNADTLKLGYEKYYTPDTELGKWLRTKNSVEKIGNLLFVHAGIRVDFPKGYSINEINENVRKRIDKALTDNKLTHDIFIGNEGPLWYRGIATGKESQQGVDATLAHFKAGKMIIGHTIVDEIKYLYNQKVIAIDLDHQENTDKGNMFALWIEKGKFYSISNTGHKKRIR